MIQDNGRVKRSEKGLLTPDNCAVAFIDHQPQMLFGTCVALPTVQALHDGYDINVAKDCCGDVSQLAHDNGMQRVVQAGAKPVTALSVLLEWQRDWAQRDTYDAVMDLVKRHFGAYGIGVEYAYTMVHGAPPSHFPEYAIPELAVAHS